MPKTSISYSSFKKNRPSWTKFFRRQIEFYILCFFMVIGSKIPFEWLQRLGQLLGQLAYRVLRKDRGIINYQLEMAFPEMPILQRQQWTRDCFQHFGQLLFELVGLKAFSKEFEERVTVIGEKYLEEALARKKGVILVSPHFGNWEFAAPYFSKRPYVAKIVAKPLYDPRFDLFLKQSRESERIRQIDRGSAGEAIALFRCLKRNELLFVLVDQDIDVKSLFVPFFGIPAHTPVGISSLALKTGASLLSFSMRRMPQGRFEMTLTPMGHFEKSRPSDGDLFRVTRHMNVHMEQIIRKDPPQWAWFHRRWKRRPTPEQLEQLTQWEKASQT